MTPASMNSGGSDGSWRASAYPIQAAVTLCFSGAVGLNSSPPSADAIKKIDSAITVPVAIESGEGPGG